VQTESLEIDHVAYQVIAGAQDFDVVAAPNLFGDIVADGAALLLGSRGLSYSANFGPRHAAVYQTGHGAAYDIAGLDVANPIGQILTTAMMLRETFGDDDAAAAINGAVAETVRQGYRTRDIAAPGATVIGTQAFGQLVVERLAAPVDPPQQATT
jgi:3-isopropylmalate dehydrogenase